MLAFFAAINLILILGNAVIPAKEAGDYQRQALSQFNPICNFKTFSLTTSETGKAIACCARLMSSEF
ncbi:MAG: hypothetical protein CMO71_03725 [Verrucomicrobiales bacterium]|nr:hypothetical protein [Verrucomicrobiales bacterium]